MRYVLLKLFLLMIIAANGQTNDNQSINKAITLGVSLDTYVLHLWDGLEVGASVFYAKDFYKKGKHSFAYKPSIGFFNSINTENRYILGLGAQYRFEATKRSNIRVSLNGNYVLTQFLYDRFEYNSSGQFIKQKNTESNFAPSIDLQYSYNLFKIKSASFAPFIGYQRIKLESGEYTKITEGFSSGISLGILCKF